MNGRMRAASYFLLVLLVTSSRGQSASAGAGTTSVASSRVKHVIVLMMENRSFDHMLGWLSEVNPEVDGLTGSECNHVDASNPSSPAYCVNKHGYDVSLDDPNHSFSGTAFQIYGREENGTSGHSDVGSMSGFVNEAALHNGSLINPMSMFTPDSGSAPVLNTLALEFAVFDRWFCSVPGPTDPNRGFATSGTSNGMLSNWNGTTWSQQSFFDYVAQHNRTFKAYYQDDLWAIMYYADMHKIVNAKRVQPLDQFYKDAASGDLAQFTWMQPRMTSAKGPPTWQHPEASVREGERLYKQIYEAVRASPAWNETALVITYDEHGGFYDHVVPPQTGVPSPDGVKSSNGFDFDRLGVRVPTVVISPWVKKGTVVHEPSGPTPTSQYDGTSSIATATNLLGIEEHITKRAAWAGTFEHLFEELDEPRTDCPKTLPDVPKMDPSALQRQRALPPNDHLAAQVEFYCAHNYPGDARCATRFQTNYDASVFVDAEAINLLNRIRA